MNSFKLMSGKIAKSTEYAGWWDIYSNAAVRIYPGVICMVPTGIVSICQPGIRMRYSEKSGLSSAGFDIVGGCIDSDYEKEWFVLLRFLMPTHLDKDVTPKKQWANVESILGKGYIEIPADSAVCQFKFEKIIDSEIEMSAEIGAFIIVDEESTRTGGFGEATAKRELREYLDGMKRSGVELLLADINFKRLAIAIQCKWTFVFNGYTHYWTGDIEAFTLHLFQEAYHGAKVTDCVII